MEKVYLVHEGVIDAGSESVTAYRTHKAALEYIENQIEGEDFEKVEGKDWDLDRWESKYGTYIMIIEETICG